MAAWHWQEDVTLLPASMGSVTRPLQPAQLTLPDNPTATQAELPAPSHCPAAATWGIHGQARSSSSALHHPPPPWSKGSGPCRPPRCRPACRRLQ